MNPLIPSLTISCKIITCHPFWAYLEKIENVRHFLPKDMSSLRENCLYLRGWNDCILHVDVLNIPQFSNASGDWIEKNRGSEITSGYKGECENVSENKET